MKFIVRKSSDYRYEREVEIYTLEGLIDLYNEYGGTSLIIDFDETNVEVYDDYRE